MEKQHINQGIRKALEFLKARLNKNEWKEGEKLPSLKILATQAHIGYISLIKAVNILQEKKVLISRRKAGTYVGAVLPDKKKAPLKKRALKHYAIEEQIKKEILEGRFHESEHLPGFKELKTIFQSSYVTLKKSLQCLVDMEIISHGKQKYSICRPSNQAPLNKIEFITSRKNQSFLFFLNERMWLETFLRSLEKECLHRNVLLNKIFLPLTQHLQPSPKNILGYIFWYFENNEKEHNEILDNLRKLAQSNKPIVLVINAYQMAGADVVTEIARKFQAHNNVYIIHFPDNRGYATMLGRFLINKGYKKAIYFYMSNTSWAVERYDGLVAAFSTREMNNAVLPFAISGNEFASHEFAYTDQKDAALIKSMEKKRLTMESFIKPLQDEAMRASYCSIDERLSWQIYEMENGLMLRQAFQRLFREAANLKGKMAWVCADDYIANYAALPFLVENKISVPENIGLIGFNDQSESLVNGVTSFNFDFQTMALRSINFILYPDDKQWKKDRKDSPIVSIKGMVIDRGSV